MRACSASLPRSRRSTRCEDRRSGDDLTGCAASRRASCCSASAASTLWRIAPARPPAVRRYLRRAGILVAAVLAAVAFVFPTGSRYLFTHIGREQSSRRRASAPPHEHVPFPTSDGLTLSGWYVPSKNGAAMIAFPGQRPAAAGAHAGPPRLRRAALRPPRRGRQRRRPERLRLGGRGHQRRRRLSAPRPDVDPDRIGGMGLSVGGETAAAGRRAQPRASRRRVRGRGRPLGARGSCDMPMPAPQYWASMPGHDRRRHAAVFANRRRRRTSSDLVARIAPRRCCSSRRRTASTARC